MSRRKRGHGGGHSGDHERWLLTYADMITLLLALFIVLFAMSSIDATNFDSLKRTLAQSFRGQVMDDPGAVMPGHTSVLEAESTAKSVSQLSAESAQATAQQMSKAAEKLKGQSGTLGKKVQVSTTERGIVIRLEGDAFFESGSAQVKPGLAAELHALAKLIADEKRPLAIEGHTDGQPMSGGVHGNNMVLSQARAGAVWGLLTDAGVAKSGIHTSGFADTRPLKKPQYQGQAVAENRRVEIVLLAPGSSGVSGRAAGSPVVPTIGGGKVTPIAPPSAGVIVDVLAGG